MIIELVIAGAGILSSAIFYKLGLKKGKEDGYTVGLSHGMFKANELINEKKAFEDGNRNRKSFEGVKHRLNRSHQEPAWIG
jgi:hypothetical protein